MEIPVIEIPMIRRSRKAISVAAGTALISISSLAQAADYEVTVTNLTAGIQ